MKNDESLGQGGVKGGEDECMHCNVFFVEIVMMLFARFITFRK